jgi:lipopolysaccharide transport system permease protein
VQTENSIPHHEAGNDGENWDIRISADRGYLDINLREIWRYRDLLTMFVKKDIITVYKQTILGPIWFLLQPILTAMIYAFIFGQVARISTGNAPQILFYLGSFTIWNYFAETFKVTSKTFSENATVFGKVYFPRIILPLSKVISGIIKLLIQFVLFFLIWFYYLWVKHAITPNWHMVFFPLILLVIAFMSLGFGIIITSLTTKYRDLNFLIAFGIQLLQFVTPVIFPISSIKDPSIHLWLWLNPLASLFEAFKYAFLGQGSGVFSYYWLGYSVIWTVVALFIGIVIFSRVEKKFIDTV